MTRRKKSVHTLDTETSFTYPIPNDRIYYLTNSTLPKGKDKFTMHTKGKGYHFPKAPIYTGTKDPTLIGHIEIKPVGMTDKHLRRLEAHELYNLYKTQYEKVQDLDDSYADVLDCITILWGEKATHLDSFVEISVDDILRLRAKKHKINGQQRGRGYHPKQREEVASIIWDLAAITVSTIEDMHVVPGANRTKWTFSIINIASEKKDTEFNQTARIAFKIKLGDLFAYRILKNRQTALIDKKLLHLDHRKYWVEKRIGRYIGHLWRSDNKNSKPGKSLRIGTILDEIGLQEDTYSRKSKVKDRFIHAIERLEELRVIGEIKYLDDIENIDMRDPKWFDIFRKSRIVLVPPECILEQYDKIVLFEAKNKTKKNTQDNAQRDYGSTITETYRRRGMTLTQVAEELEISLAYLSQIRRGKVKPSARIKKKIDKWLEENKS